MAPATATPAPTASALPSTASKAGAPASVTPIEGGGILAERQRVERAAEGR